MLIKVNPKMTEAERSVVTNTNNLYLQSLSIAPIGFISIYPGSDIPRGYLLCDGTQLDVNEYPELFAVIGYTYGGTDDMFYLPDLRGRTVVGQNDTDFDKLGGTGGEVTHELTQEELPAYDIPFKLQASSDGIGDWSMLQRGWDEGSNIDITSKGSLSIWSGGQNKPHNNMPPYVVINYIIKADQGSIHELTDEYNAIYSNALKGEVVGQGFVTVQDVSPVPHNALVKVKKMTPVSVTIMDGECSSYSFSGGASQFIFKSKEKLTPSACFEFYTDQDTTFWFCFEETIILNEDFYLCVSYSDMVLHLSFYRDAELTDLIDERDWSVAYENLETKIIQIDFCGSTHDVLITQEEYEYAPAANTSISVGGKNLLNLEGRSVVNFGGFDVTSKRKYQDGKGIILGYTTNNYYIGGGNNPSYSVTSNEISYTLTMAGYGIGVDVKLKPNTEYKLSCSAYYGWQMNLIEFDAEGNYLGTMKNGKTRAETDWGLVYISSGTKGDVVYLTNPQLEYGTVASEYEPYIEPVTYTANADGSVDGVKSIYPSTSVSVEDASTVVSIEYNRDINKAFAELSAAIISLGGNV